uniref:Prickle-like protein 2 n=1 Tax=Parastrongyloides trichosuri TaxID=131310 RepID=A0A0N4ZCR9_PARTI
MSESQVNLLNPYFEKLEIKPKHTIAHEYGSGSRCLNCNCPGLDLHFWRKICKACSCRMDEHDVIVPSNLDHGAHIRKLLIEQSNTKPSKDNENFLNIKNKIGTAIFHRKEYCNENNSIGSSTGSLCKSPLGDTEEPIYGIDHKNTTNNHQFFDISDKDNKNINMLCNNENDRQCPVYTWLPQGVSEHTVSEYMNCIPTNDRPIEGTEGAQLRRTKLAYQLPYHDSDPTACKSLQKDEDFNLHTKFVEKIKHNVVGVGEIVNVHRNYGTQTPNNVSCQTNNYENTDCYNCNTKLGKCNVAVDTSKGPGKNVFHPTCFKCDVCNQLLVDLLYFFYNGKYYCGRHYGEQIYSRCFGCDELIFQNEYTLAEGKNWHVEHFCCFGCDMALGGHKYCVKEEKPYCVPCYMSKFAKTCETCRQKIPPDSERLIHSNMTWHATSKCFKCHTCNKALQGLPFMIKSNKLFCSGDCRNRCKDVL